MADRKTTRSRKRQSRMLRFPEAKGKTLEVVEVDPDVTAITILFEDKTALSFDLDPTLLVFPELGSLKTGNWRSRKRWPVMLSAHGKEGNTVDWQLAKPQTMASHAQ